MFPNLFQSLARAAPFKDRQFSAWSLAFVNKEHLEFGDKILLPQSAFHDLARLKISYPMMFSVRNPVTGLLTHVGILEFTAEEGRVYLPHWIMQLLLVENGQKVQVSNVSLPKGSFVQLRPHETAFTQLSNPRVVLERSLRQYSCLTKGQQIVIDYGEGALRQQFTLDVVETKPADAISIIETDLNVDFLPPRDMPPEPQKPAQGSRDRPLVIDDDSGDDDDEKEDDVQMGRSPELAAVVSQQQPGQPQKQPSYFERLGAGRSIRGGDSSSSSAASASPPSSSASVSSSSSSESPAAVAAAEASAPGGQADKGRRVVQTDRFTFIYEDGRLVRRIPRPAGAAAPAASGVAAGTPQASKPDWRSSGGHRLR